MRLLRDVIYGVTHDAAATNEILNVVFLCVVFDDDFS